MCGICGYINIDNEPVADNEILRRMARAIAHRGPDDEGFYIKGNAALGHKRLSIIDLKSGGQPMSDDTGALIIIYNGEVYNFRELKAELIDLGCNFHTHSDTEVVLNAYRKWGPGCLDKFNGMFAFAIWDNNDKSLFLARDRFGKKPLYYGRFKNTFIFGSELKSVFQHPAVAMDIDRLALGKYFAHDYIPSPRSIIKGISKLEAGHYLFLNNGEVTKKRYWDFTFDVDPGLRSDLESTKKTLVDLLRESVKRRLISDVPLGVFLSGGIDSSAVVAMMSTLMSPKDIKTFSIGFKDRSYNEAGSASLVARHFGTDHYEKILGSDMMMACLPKVLDIIDEPFADSSIIPTYLVSSFTREKVTVALGGDGGDELFMGYPSFIAHRMAVVYDRFPNVLKKLASRVPAILPAGPNYMGLPFKIRRFLRGANYSRGLRHQVWIGSFPPGEQGLLFLDKADRTLFDPMNIYSESSAYFDKYKDISDMDRVEYLYIKTYLTDDILAKVDRASMAASLEVRAPFLDNDFAKFSGSIPNDLKLKGLQTKFILKEAMKEILPREIVYKPKHGFAVPISSWFRSELKGLLFETFEKKKIEGEGIFRHSFIENLLKEHISGKRDHGRAIWSLFVFEMWYNKWISKSGKSSL